MMDPINAEMTLAHGITIIVSRCTKGAGQGATVTAHTDVRVDIDDPAFLTLINGTGRAGHHTWRITAMKTGQGDEMEINVWIGPLFH